MKWTFIDPVHSFDSNQISEDVNDGYKIDLQPPLQSLPPPPAHQEYTTSTNEFENRVLGTDRTEQKQNTDVVFQFIFPFAIQFVNSRARAKS